MKKIFSLTFAGFLILPLSPILAEENMESSEPLSETIHYEIKEKLEINKIPPEIKLDIQEVIESGTTRTDDVLEQAKLIPSDDDFEHYAYLNSNQVIRPWMPLLPEPPLVTFYPGLSKVAAKRWEFKVSNETGEVIKIISGKGAPPRQFLWNGLNRRGEYIQVGTLYSYQFITFDEHGNAHTFPGEPFELDALKYKQKGNLIIEFANRRLFLDDTALFRPTMKGFLERAIDVVREYSNKPLTVEMYANHVRSPLAEERRQAMVKLVSNATNTPAVDIRHKVDKISERGDVIRFVLRVR